MATGLITNVSSIFFKCRSIVFTQLQAKGISSTMNKFEEEKIVPDVIPVAPKEILKVSVYYNIRVCVIFYIVRTIRSMLKYRILILVYL